MTFIRHDHMIQTLPPDRSDDALDIGVLPRRSWRRRYFDDIHRRQTIAEYCSAGCVAIADQVSRRGVPRERLHELMPKPSRRRMGGNVEVNHLAPIPFALEYRNLMAKRNEFESQRGPVSKACEDDRSQKSEDRMHPLTLSASTPNR